MKIKKKNQKEAKKYRTGIKYTHLKLISGGEFKHPKVWSNTRMVVYEFEMLERFLENQEYFDHYPSKYLIMAQVHCLVMFAMKIILRAVQKTTITFHYINTVIEGDVRIFENPSNINRKLILCDYS